MATLLIGCALYVCMLISSNSLHFSLSDILKHPSLLSLTLQGSKVDLYWQSSTFSRLLNTATVGWTAPTPIAYSQTCSQLVQNGSKEYHRALLMCLRL